MKHEIHMIINTLIQLSINITHENKHEQSINVSVQITCEYHNHENFSIKLNYSLNKKTRKSSRLFNLQGICMSNTN